MTTDCGIMNRKDKTESRDASKKELIIFGKWLYLGVRRRKKPKKNCRAMYSLEN